MSAKIHLPIDSRLDEIAATVKSHQNIVLTAAPGAGKTTRVPPKLLDVVGGRIIVLQPRRMAAVAACHRVCEERGWTIGREAGYSVRFETKASRDTRLVFMTDATLLRQISSDPELKGVGMVVLDEFHERNLNQDLVLGYLREQQELGSAIKMMIMSATLSLEKMQRHLGSAAVIDVEGQSYPLTIQHQTESITLNTGADFIERVAFAVGRAWKEVEGDVLVFLPGVGEIARVHERLEGGPAELQVLHGSLPLKEQQQVLRPWDKRRVILSTNVAEASVTVPGVNCVIDTGVAKIMNCNLRTGFSQLELQRISLFNAKQRAGRAARQRPGVCIRLWTSFEENTQALEPVPECHRVDLAGALLWLADLGVTRFDQFMWLEQPPGRLIDYARKSLLWLGALDADSRITEFGRKLNRYPLPPRWGALLAMGEERGIGTTAASMAAILSERDFVRPARGRGDSPSGGWGAGAPVMGAGSCDVWRRLEMLEEQRGRDVETVRQTAKQLENLVSADKKDAKLEDVQQLLLLSQGDRLCRKRDSAGERALMVGQKGIRLAPESQARGQEFFVALQGVDLPGQADTMISMASGFDKNFVLKHLAGKIQTAEDVYFDSEKEQFFGRRGRFVFDLPIDSPALTPVKPEQVSEKMAEVLWERWGDVREKHEGVKAFWSRWEFLLQYKPELAEQFPEEKLREALAMAGYGSVSFKQVLEKDMVGFFRQALGREVLTVLDREVPAEFEAPSGVSHKIDYSEKHSAFVDVRLQEIFGLAASPRLAFGKVPITFRLLGPNYRPVQVTSDLASFWRGGYHEVRRDLRARYPKHSWPEDGLTAKPEAKGRRRN